ncbi:MAG: C40 family peptidase [Luteimonas sp.]
MTTSATASGHLAGRPRAFPLLLSRLLGCALLALVAVPAFAQQSAPAMAESGSLAAASVTPPALSAPAISDEIQLPSHAMSFIGPASHLPAMDAKAPAQPAASGGRIQSLVQHALALLGTPYRWGGTGTDGFDCSGLVGYVFRSALGIELPRVSREMANSGQLVADRASLSPGDLVFFGTHHGKRVDHVGIYVGDGRFLHAPRTGRDVTVSRLDSGYWSDKFMEARRVAGI